MASGAFFDPLRFLRIAPLITSTGSLVYATSELLHNSAFLQPAIRKKSDTVLPGWYSFVFNRGVGIVLFFNLSTTSATIANLWLGGRGSVTSLSSKLYWAGLAFAVGHLAFVPWVAAPVDAIVRGGSAEGATSDMSRWLGVHKIRMAVADFPAWVSFLGAVMMSAPL
ncbi:hypothetical protein FQN54_006595 [Arachnomyces sp. PD_36]|nr:hypothetical protein FQN54_006595 [Arachnomyces sp. PD_36]